MRSDTPINGRWMRLPLLDAEESATPTLGTSTHWGRSRNNSVRSRDQSSPSESIHFDQTAGRLIRFWHAEVRNCIGFWEGQVIQLRIWGRSSIPSQRSVKLEPRSNSKYQSKIIFLQSNSSRTAEKCSRASCTFPRAASGATISARQNLRQGVCAGSRRDVEPLQRWRERCENPVLADEPTLERLRRLKRGKRSGWRPLTIRTTITGKIKVCRQRA